MSPFRYVAVSLLSLLLSTNVVARVVDGAKATNTVIASIVDYLDAHAMDARNGLGQGSSVRPQLAELKNFASDLSDVVATPSLVRSLPGWLRSRLHTDARTFREGFGLVVAIYAGYMLIRPNVKYRRQMNRSSNALVGFGGGLVGGLTAMPGALPAIWCDMHGVPKNQQRGLVQPFIAVMQISALALMLARQELSFRILIDLASSIPALLAGSALGIFAFRNVSELIFRRIVLIILLLSGIALVV